MDQQAAQPVPLRIFVNPHSGGGSPDEALRKALEEAGVTAVIVPTAPQQLRSEVERAVAEKWPAVGVSGGDGSLVSAAAVLAGSDTELVPFPTGTLNHFARRLGIDDIRRAAEGAAGGETVSAPVGIIDDSVFLNTATFGLYADVVRKREKLRKWLRKWPAAVVGFIGTISKLRMLSITLVVDGEWRSYETPLLWVGVGYGSFPFVHESPDDRQSPELEVVIFQPRSRWDAVTLVMRLTMLLRNRDRIPDEPRLELFHTRELIIHANRRIGVTLDGEVSRSESPIFVGVQDGAMKVRIPPTDEEGRAKSEERKK